MNLFQDLDNPVLAAILAPLAPLLAVDGVVEVAINKPGEAWLQIHGEWVHYPAPELTRSWAESLCHTLGSLTHRAFTPEKPVLRCSLPGGHRFTAMLGSNVASGVAIAIRIRRVAQVALDAFGLTPAQIDDLVEVARSQPVVMVGDRGAGKTTFLDSFARMVISPDDRVITVQDVAELVVTVPNSIEFLVSRGDSASKIDYSDLIDTLTRFMAKWLLLGELSVHNAAALFRLINAGTTNVLTTAHGNRAVDLFEAWRRNWELSTGNSGASIVPFLRNAIGRIVLLGRDRDDRRRVHEIVDPQTLDLDVLLGQRSGGPDWARISGLVHEAIDRIEPWMAALLAGDASAGARERLVQGLGQALASRDGAAAATPASVAEQLRRGVEVRVGAAMPLPAGTAD